MRIGTRRKKYFSTFQLSTPLKVLEMELQWTTQYWIHAEVHNCSSSNPQPSEAMRIWTRKKKYFSTFTLSTPQKVLEMELQWTSQYWIHTKVHNCSSSIHRHPRPWELERGRRNTSQRSNSQKPRKVLEIELQWTTRHWIHIEVHTEAHPIYITIRDHESWDAEEKTLLHVPTLDVSECIRNATTTDNRILNSYKSAQ